MSYLALARKWRPKAFSEVVGQQHVVQALSNALDTGRIHHAFLFTGTRGVGKTTLARIFAKSLNCEEGTSAEPCQKCGTCLSIDEGRYVDLIEVDAASRTKVDETRELLENVQYAPTSGKYKVYLIDEVHMFSGHSFNALLKTLEEPPEHVKFLFATTDPQKLPVTILSRCLQFNLRAMRPEQVENQLVKILNSEDIAYDIPALTEISRAADGSMRDGLSLLDQAIAQGSGEVRLDNVRGMLGSIKSEHTQKIVEALCLRDVDLALHVIAEMANNAVDFTTALDDLLMALYHISLAQVTKNIANQSQFSDQKLKEFVSNFDAETLQLFYQIGLISKKDISLAPSRRVGFEMALLRMLAFEPADRAASGIKGLSLDSNRSEQTSNLEDRSVSDSSVLTEKKTAKFDQVDSKVADVVVDKTPSTANNKEEREPQKQEIVDSTSQSTMGAKALYDVPSAPPIEISTSAENELSAYENIKESNDNSLANQKASTDSSVVVNQRSHSSADSELALDNTPGQTAGSSASLDNLIAVTLAGNNEWGELIEQTTLVGMAKELAMNCAADRINEERIDLCLSPKLEHLYSDDRYKTIQSAVRLAVNSEIKVSLDIDDSNRETPSECLSRLGFEQQEKVREQIRNDPGVKSIISAFGASIKENSIKPIDA
ncbi:MAG: DNA polymerase III subunit gamma/tau [Gammaproteobacteria bacterium]|nr:DNA polymerase III subunit gamma/tau [Gammaproteobacteria bacterium]